MKTKYKARGVSMPPELFGDADRRVEKLKPWVSSFSSYIQRLIRLDLERGLLDPDGGINQDVVGEGQKPNFKVASVFCETQTV